MIPPRELARRVLERVDGGGYATLTLAAALSRSQLEPADRALATELVYGELRQRRRLEHALVAYAPRGLDGLDPAVRRALRLAAYQILCLRVPAHAAVDDAVEWIKQRRGTRLAAFGNALLRRLCRDGEPPPPSDPQVRLGVVHSAPDWLVGLAQTTCGPDAEPLLGALLGTAPTWLRVNRRRGARGAVIARLTALRPGAQVEASPLLDEAVAARQGGDLAATSLFTEGLVTIQDLGAQVVGRLLDPQPGELILDACAGVGGKATHLAELAQGEARIDAADLSPRKLELARATAQRLGAGGIAFHRLDLTAPTSALASAYDRVLLDAPCSGLGVLRRHPEARWRPAPDLAGLADLQRRLLDGVAARLRPGGLLVYAVCTFTGEEGPAQVQAFLARHPDFAVEPPPPLLRRFAAVDGSLRTWPQRDDADAFFAIRLRRR